MSNSWNENALKTCIDLVYCIAIPFVANETKHHHQQQILNSKPAVVGYLDPFAHFRTTKQNCDKNGPPKRKQNGDRKGSTSASYRLIELTNCVWLYVFFVFGIFSSVVSELGLLDWEILDMKLLKGSRPLVVLFRTTPGRKNRMFRIHSTTMSVSLQLIAMLSSFAVD